MKITNNEIVVELPRKSSADIDPQWGRGWNCALDETEKLNPPLVVKEDK